MSQNDFTIANQTFPNTRADINSALQALASTSSGSSAPSTTFANQFFYNTTSNLLQIRNEANDAFITIAELDQTNDTVEYFKADAVRVLKVEALDGDDAIIVNDGGGIICPAGVDLTATELILDADNDTTIRANTDDRIDFKIGGNILVEFNANGITVTDGDGSQPNIRLVNTNADTSSSFLDFVKDGASPADNDNVQVIRCIADNSSGATKVFTTVVSTTADVTAGTENGTYRIETLVDGTNASRFNIDSAGRIGIGIASPSGKFAVSDGTTDMEMNPASGVGFLGNRTNHRLDLMVNASSKMTIDTAGRILCAQTASFVNGSSAKLQVSYVKNSEFGLFIRPSDNNTGGGQPALFQNQAGTSIGSIGATASNISYNTSSDYRLKENVSYSWDATSRLKQLKPARFNWIIDDTNTAIDGFMAHEVTSIVPDAVQGTKDGTKTRTKFIEDEAGNFIASDVEEADWTTGKEDGTYESDSTWTASEVIPDYQSIDHSKLVPLLVKTIQELEARITALES